MRRAFRLCSIHFLTLLVAITACSTARSQTWVPTTGGTFTWNDVNNWDTLVVPNTNTAAAIMGAITGDELVTLDIPITVNSINFTNTANVYTIANGAGGSLTLAGTTPTITVSTAGVTTIISATISGTTAWSKAGAGILTLSGANNFSAGLTLTAGQLNINSTTALGATASTFTIQGATTIDNTSGSAITNANNNAMAWNGDFTFGGTNALNLGTGAVTLSGARIVTVNGTGALTIGGGISGATFGITKAGSGTLVLNGIIGTTTGGITVNGGTLTLAGANTYTGAVTLAPGATLNVNNAGALSTGTFTINGGTINNSTGAAITNSKVTPMVWGGDFIFTGTQSLNLGTGAVTALAASRQITVNANTLTVGGTISGASFILTKAGAGTLTLTGVISSTLGLTVASSGGNLILASATASTFTGATTINTGGTLQFGNQTVNVLQAGTNTITNNGTLIFAPGTTTLTYPNIINGNGNITLNGAAGGAPANITLSATTGTFSGTYTLNQGRIQITAQTNLGSATSAITVNGNSGTLTGGQLLINAAVAIANPITLNGYGPTEATGNLGAIRLNTAASSYTGTISLGSNASINTQGIAASLSAAAVITGGAGAQLMIGAPITGTGAGNNGGTLTISSVNSFTGGTLISGQTAALAAAGALGTGPVQVGINVSQTNSGLTQSVANALTGTNSLIVNAGTVALSQANNYTGGTTLNSGTLTITAAAGLGTADLSFLGGTLNLNIAGALRSFNLNQLGGTANQSVVNAFTGPIALNLSGGTTNLSFANTYLGGANISGTNLTNVTAVGALNGTTTVTGGTLSSGVTAVGANTGAILLSGGVLASSVAGGQFQNVFLSSTGALNPGGVGTVGSLTISGLNTTGGTLQFDALSPSNTDLLNVTGSYNFGAGTNIALSNLSVLPTAAGNYKLIQYAGATPNLANFVLPTAPAGISYALSTSADPGFVDLVISGTYSAITANWIPTATPGPFSWATAANWSGGVVPSITGDTANFNSALAGPQAVTVDGQQHVGTLILNPTTAFAYSLNQGTAGSTLYLDNGASAASIQNLAQNNLIAAPINLVSSNTNVTVGGASNLTLTGVISGAGKLTLAAGSTGTLTLNGTGAYTGGTDILGGTVIISATGGTASQINNAGNGVITLNGGTLSFTATTGTTTPPAGFALVIGAAGGTLNVSGATVNGKLLMTGQNPGWLSGSGTLTKTGGGDWQTSVANLNFTGNIIMNGLVEVQGTATLGFGTTTGFNGGSLTVNAGGEVVASGANVQIFNPVTLNTGTLSSNSGPAIFNSTVNVTGTSTLAARLFQTVATSQNFAIKTLTGSGNLTVIGGTTVTGVQGLVTIGNATGYIGTITVGTNGAIGIGDSSGGNFFGSANAISVSTVSSAVGLIADGDGTSTPQTLSFTLPSNPITFVAANVGGYLVGKQGASTQFNQEANKTISVVGALPYNNTNVLNVTPLNGYGLLLTAQPSMAAITTFNVGGTTATTQASNVVPGLTLQNLASTGATGIVKTGTGTLLLGSGNTFGGAAALIDITAGTVAAAFDADLGNSANGIRINNATAGAAGFLATGTFATSRVITIQLANGNIGVSGGNTLTLNSGLSYAVATNTFNKTENGTLILTAAATTTVPTSVTTVNAGILQISASNQVGSGALTNASAGAAIQLTGGGTITQPVALNSVGISSTVGGLTNLSGATTLSGTITINGGSLITNQDSGNTFTLTGITNTTTGFNTGGAGPTTIGGAITGGGVVQAFGSLRLTGANTVTGNVATIGGTLTISGATGVAGGAGTTLVQYGGTLNFDNSVNNLNNRNAGRTLSFASNGSGTVNLIGNAAAPTTEQFAGFATGRGEFVISVQPNAAQSATMTLTNAGTFTRNNFASIIYQAPGLGSAAAAGVGVINQGPIANTGFQGAFVTGGQANQQIQPWALAFNTSNPSSAITFATASAATGTNYRPLAANESTNAFVNYSAHAGSSVGTATVFNTNTITITGSSASLFLGEAVSGNGIAANSYITAISGTTITLSAVTTLGVSTPGVILTYSTTGTNITLTTAGSANGNTDGSFAPLTPSINSLTLATGGSLSLRSSQTLTIGGASGGGILATDTTSGNTISGPGAITAGANELMIHTIGNLTISSSITGGATGAGVGLTKGDSGTLSLTGIAFYNGQTVLNAGTLDLNGGNNTIRYANYLSMASGSVLNLNGNSQIILDFFSDSASLSGLGIVGANSTVTGTTGATLVIKGDGSARNYTGTITGAVGLVHSNTTTAVAKIFTRDQTYTGPTLINGGTLSLANDGRLSGTSSLTVSRATLQLDNTGSADRTDRLSASLPITLQGGTISYLGRTQFTSTQTLGAVSAFDGANTISVTNGAAGVSTAQLTLTSLVRSTGATVNFANSGGTLGTIGSNPLILIPGTVTSNNIIGGGFTVNGTDFASYNNTYGVGALGTTGFAGYSPFLINNAAVTDNVSMAASTGVNLNNQTINSLRITGVTAINFNAGQTLILSSGGLLVNSNLTMGSAVNQGNLTSGGTELFLYVNSGTSTINSAITGSGVALVKSGAGAITIAGTNSYTGGTYLDQGTLTLASSGTLGTGGIFHNGGTLTQTAGGVIPTQAVTISGNAAMNISANLAITGTTTLNSNTISVTTTVGITVGMPVSGTGLPGGEFVTSVNPVNNTVTITSGAGVTAGTNSLTFLVNNTFTSLTFNNNGGVTAPTLTPTGLFTLSTGVITATSNNVGSTNTIAAGTGGTIDLNNVAAPTITVSPITFNGKNIAPLQPTLIINAILRNANSPVQVNGGGNLQLGGASSFTGGVNLAGGTNITIGASSTNIANGPLTGPLGTGTLTIGVGSTLLSTGAFNVGNNVVISGNFAFDAPSTTAASLSLGVNSSGISLPAAAATTINVIAPNMTGTLNSGVSGVGSSIVKEGLGTLTLNNAQGGVSTFNGGVTINNGTLIATGIGASGTSLGTGTVTINGGVLALRHSGQSSNGLITYGNNVLINGSLANAFIDINNNGANTGNTIVMGQLNYTGFTGGNPAPTTVLNVTGGNGYRLLFSSTTLTGATTSPTFNVGSGLIVVLPGGFTVGTNLPTNIGLGTLFYSGSNGGTAPTITGAVPVAPTVAASTTPLGTGTITLNAGSTLQILPLYSSANPLSTTGYTSGGMTGKYYFTSQATMASASNFGIAPNSQLAGIQPNDSLLRQAPTGVNVATLTNSLALYQGLLNITTGGTYYFGGGSDDQLQITVDGQVVQQDIPGGHGLNQQALQSIILAAGAHQVTIRAFNNAGGGSVNAFYSGPDTATNGINGLAVVNNFQALPLTALAYATNFTAANNYQNAAILNNPISVAAGGSATIDGLGTDANYAVPSLTLGAGSTLVVANGTGASGSIGNGAFIVTGVTDVTAGTGIVSPTTGTLVLAGGINDGSLGLTKTGAGNLILGSSTAFTGDLNINAGFVQLASGTALPTGTTNIGVATTTPATLDLNGQTVSTASNIVLNGGAGPAVKSSNAAAGLYNSSFATASLPAGSFLSIGAPTATVNASVGGFGDIIINATIQDSVAGSAWNKVSPNTLTLGGSNTFTGQFNITAGKVVLSNTGALGGVAGATVVSNGATLDLNSLAIGAEPITLNGAGVTGIGAPNTLGNLINSSASAASLSGPVTLATGTVSIGGPSLFAGGGEITLSGGITGAFQITKVGANDLTITGASGVTPMTLLDVQMGRVTFRDQGTQGAVTANANILRPGASLVLDNFGTAVSNRLGGRGLFVNGNYTIVGNSTTAVSEIVTVAGNNLNLGTNGTGQSTITLDASPGANVTLQVNSTATAVFTRSAGTSLLLRGTLLGTAAPGAGIANLLPGTTALGTGASIGQTGAAGATNRLILPWMVVDTSVTGVGTSFGGTSTTNGYQALAAADGIATAPTIITLNANEAASTTLTVTNTTGIVNGQLVVGTGIAAGTTVTGTTATTITLSVAATATANNTLSFYTIGATPVGTFANLISTNATNPVGSAFAAQELNSVTLNNAGGASLAITTGLQLDSGGILVVGTDGAPNSRVYTISGTGTLTGTNTLNRELIIHTTGTGTTLNITAPIFVNGGGLTKADGGKLAIGTQAFYTGDTAVNSGTLQLASGAANTIFKPYSTAPSSGNSGVAFSGQNLTVNIGGTLDLNGNNQAIANLRSGGTVPLSGGTIINSTGTATLHITLNATQTWAGNINNVGAGTLNVVRDGNNTLLVNSPNNFTGSLTVTGGATTLTDLGTFENASSVTVVRSALIWQDTGIQAVSNRLSPSVPITLVGGGLNFQTRAGTGAAPVDAISLGTLNLGVGASNIAFPTINQGGAAKVTFAGLGTRAVGATLSIGSAAFAVGDNPQVFFTSAPTLTNGIIGAWAVGNGLATSNSAANAAFLTYDPASGVRLLQYQPIATYGAGINTLLTATATLPVFNNTVNSLTMYGTTTLNFVNATDTLTVQSGGILSGTDATNKTLGSTTIQGQIVAGAGNDLYLHVGSSTLTINSKIIDNGSNNNVVITALSTGGATVTLTNANTYGGTTYLNGATLSLNSLLGPAIPGNIVLSGGNNASTDSLVFNATNLVFSQSNQIASTANVTMNGATQINLGNAVLGTATTPNSQTINNLIINNDGGTNGGGPSIFTGAGTLTINGTITSTNNTEVATVPVINGFISLTTGNMVVDPNQFVPNQIVLAINANITAPSITKSGNGYLGIGGQSGNMTGAININGGGLAFSGSVGTGGALLGGQVILAANTTLDARGLTGTIGSLASAATTSSLTNGLQGTAGTVQIGLDNATTLFAGTISSPFPTGLLNVTKFGTGTMTLTNNSSATNNGTLVVGGGGITLSGANGKISFTTTTLQSGGTVTLDNSTTALSDRLGSSTLTTTAAVLAPTYRTLNMNGGNLIVTGIAGTVVNESLGNIASLAGGGTITLSAAGTEGINLTIGQIVAQSNVTSLFIRGDGLGTAAGANVATVKFTTAGAVTTFPGLTFPGTQGGGANGTTTKSIRSDILTDTSSSGLGSGFLTVDSVSGLIRPLGSVAGELSNNLATSTATTNIGLSTSATSLASVASNSLTLQGGGGVNLAVISNNAWGANGALLNMNVQNSGGLIAFSGNTGVAAGQYQSSTGVTLYFHVVGAASFNLNAPINTQNGFVKADGGTLVLNRPYYSNGQAPNTVTINGGTVQLGTGVGANALFALTAASTPTGTTLALNNGTFDLNGNNQLIGALTTSNPFPFAGGTVGSPNSVITNTSGTAATFFTNNTSTVVGTVFTGNLNLDKSGNTTMTLSSPQTYTGITTVRGGTLTLRDSGSIASAGAVNVNYAFLNLDNTGLTDSTTRLNSAAPINLTGGTLRVSTGARVESQSIGTVTLSQGISEINLLGFNNNGNSSSYSLTIGNLVQTNRATVNFTENVSGTFGAFSGANSHIYISQLNGVPFSAASLVNGIIAPWAITAQNDWATYSNAAGITVPGGNGTPGYSGNALTAGTPADNISVTATVQAVTTRTINTLAVRAPAAATTIGINGPADVLTIGFGGVILNTAQAVSIQGGSLTAGAVNTPSTLYLNAFSTGTTTVNTPIVNNGTGALTVVRSGGGIVTLTPRIVETVASVPIGPANTITVPSSAGLFVGMGVTGTNIGAGATITGIAGNVITLSVANGAAAGTNVQVVFDPPASTATSTTTAGSPTVTTAANAFAAGFTPTIGMAVGGPNIAGGATLLSFTGTNATGFTFTLSQNAIATGATAVVTVGAMSNTYTGDTVTNSGTINTAGGVLNLTGQPGSITVQGNLIINNSTVTMVTNQGQIAATSNVTINGGGVLTLVGSNSLNSLTFNNSGSIVTPSVAVATLLNLTGGASAITVTNDNPAFTPTISGTTLNFSTAPTINVSGLSPNGLIISAGITALTPALTSAGPITKTGAGSLVLPNANAASLTWILSGGSIIVNNATSLGTNAAAGALTINGSVGLQSGTAAVVMSLPIIFNAGSNLSLGGSSTVNQITLAGAVNLNGAAPTITVAAQPTTDTITGTVTGSGGFTKAGAGALTLNPTVASTFTGPVTISGGLLTMGNANALGGAGNNGSDLTVATGAALNLNNVSLSVGSLSGGGLLTNSGAAVQTLTVGTGSNANNTTFSGTLASATAANLALTKTGNNRLELTGANLYAGATLINGGTLRVNNTTGSGTGTSPVTVASGGTLDGGSNTTLPSTGFIGGTVTVQTGGKLSPGTGAGVLTVNNTVTMNAGSIFVWDINNAAPGGAAFSTGLSNVTTPTVLQDTLITNSFNATNLLFTITELTPVTLSTTTSYSFLVVQSSTAPTLTGTTTFDVTAAPNFQSYQSVVGNLITLDISGNNIYLNLSAVPEPHHVLLVCVCILLVGLQIRRRMHRKAAADLA